MSTVRGVLIVTVLGILAACGTATPTEPVSVLAGSIEQVYQEPIVENSVGSVLIRHANGDPNIGDVSIVHITTDAHIFRIERGSEQIVAFDQLAIGIIAEFVTTGYEKRTYPRQVIATRVELLSTP